MLAVGVEVTYNSTLKRVSQAFVQFTQHHMLNREIMMHKILCSALHLKLYLYFFKNFYGCRPLCICSLLNSTSITVDDTAVMIKDIEIFSAAASG